MFIITTSDSAHQVLEKLTASPEWSFEVTGIALLDQDKEDEPVFINEIPVVAGHRDLYEQLKTKVIDEVFIHLPDYSKTQIEELTVSYTHLDVYKRQQ